MRAQTLLAASSLFAAVALGSLVLPGCAAETKSGSSTSKTDGAVAQSSTTRDTTPAVAPADAASLRDGNTAFAVDLYQTLRNDPEAKGKNLFFSPHSISMALAMTYAGARGNTEKEMASAMHYDLPQDRLHPALDALDLALESRGAGEKAADGKGFRLHVTNSLWGAPQISFLSPFLDTLATSYGAGIRLTDFAKDPEAARTAINGWVDAQTEDRIKELLPSGTVTTATRFVLVNAIYFNAAWQTPFEASSTKAGTFHGAGGDVTGDMMRTGGSFPYAAGDGYQAIALPYAGGELSFVAVLPSDMSAFEPTFDAKQATYIASSLASVPAVDLTLPKFKIEGKSFSLRAALRSLGMKDAFDDSAADFSAITTTDKLSISDVIHQAFVSVDEKGTEAAAATAVIGVGSSAAPEKVVQLAFDKPFVFFVRDNATGAVLFMGRVETL